jgi:hypothetical protein
MDFTPIKAKEEEEEEEEREEEEEGTDATHPGEWCVFLCMRLCVCACVCSLMQKCAREGCEFVRVFIH